MPIALVTGANRGLGLETSYALAKKGFKVYLGVRNVIENEEVIKKFQDEKLNAHLVKLDVTKTEHLRNFASLLDGKNETLDLVINNAGVFLESDGPTEYAHALKADPVIILKTIEVNTVGPLRVIQSLETYLNDNSRIINISSVMGSLTEMGGGWPGYRMSKASLNALTRILSDELADRNISVNSVCPGWVRTDMGGNTASNSLSEGIETTMWLATMEKPPTGGFYSDCKEIPW